VVLNKQDGDLVGENGDWNQKKWNLKNINSILNDGVIRLNHIP